jgi:hypothetical protein
MSRAAGEALFAELWAKAGLWFVGERGDMVQLCEAVQHQASSVSRFWLTQLPVCMIARCALSCFDGCLVRTSATVQLLCVKQHQLLGRLFCWAQRLVYVHAHQLKALSKLSLLLLT